MITHSPDAQVKFRSDTPVILAGGGDICFSALANYSTKGFPLYAADGGADSLFKEGYVPDAIIGDMDSIGNLADWEKRSTLLLLDEQDTTDFEKCLYSISAPKFLALGFTGKRLDHSLAAIHVLVRYHRQKQVFLINEKEVAFVVHGALNLNFTDCEGKFCSIIPLQTINFERSKGLKYPIEHLEFQLGNMIGNSNEIAANAIEIVPAMNDLDIPYLVTMDSGLSEQVIQQL